MSRPVLLCSSLIVLVPFAAFAQGGGTLKGKVAEVTRKGKTVTVMIRPEAGDPQPVEITPRVKLEVVSTGDEGFFREGLTVSADCVESNKLFFSGKFRVMAEAAPKPQPPSVVTPPAVPGTSRTRKIVSGTIVGFEKVAEEKYDLLKLKSSPQQPLSVQVERNRSIVVIQTDPEQIATDMTATATGRLAGGKFLATTLVVETGKKLKADEFFAVETK